jgi:hypothetical protein
VIERVDRRQFHNAAAHTIQPASTVHAAPMAQPMPRRNDIMLSDLADKFLAGRPQMDSDTKKEIKIGMVRRMTESLGGDKIAQGITRRDMIKFKGEDRVAAPRLRRKHEQFTLPALLAMIERASRLRSAARPES